jgi:hypothetical protein
MSSARLAPQFVEAIPESLEFGVIYVSMTFATAIHQCACGCGREVVTPFSPTDWKLYFDGENVTLEPSIGNWSFPCRSHYWIRGGKVRWAGDMSQRAIDAGRAHDRKRKAAHYETISEPEETSSATEASIIAQAEGKPNKPASPAKIRSWWKRLRE